MTTLFNFACRYIAAGYAAIPIWMSPRKNPHLSSFTVYNYRLPTIKEWQRWSRNWPDCNIAIITGYWRLVCLDFDDHDSYDSWSKCQDKHILDTWTVKTARGYHVWFETPGTEQKSASYTKDDAEVLLRARGGYCIVPPSVHHTKIPYVTVRNVPPVFIDDIVDDCLGGWTQKNGGGDSSGDSATDVIYGGSAAIRIEEMITVVGSPNSRGAALAFCPFHDDEKPSAWVNVGQQRFGCNACWPGKWFDVINVYAMIHQISNDEAYRIIRRPGQG